MSTKIKTQDGWKDVAGIGDTYFVRKPAWSRAESITIAQLNAGYTIPADGMLVGYVYTTQQGTPTKIMVNGVSIAIVYGASSDVSAGNFQTQVNQGDSVTVERSVTAANVAVSFVPFEDSTVAEPEVVTPELIRNLHDPDWSQAVAITSEQLLAGYAAPKRGVFVGNVLPLSEGGSVQLRLNNIVIAFGSLGTSNGDLRNAVANVPVSQGDVIKSTAATLYDGNYKIHFVPYKAQ